jgi:hypothetical protein
MSSGLTVRIDYFKPSHWTQQHYTAGHAILTDSRRK